jgi:hypothetical protein
MIVSAQSVNDFYVTRVTGLRHPVRLTHPQGESFMDQPDGLWLRAYTAGNPRCDPCRAADGSAADDRASVEAADEVRRLAAAREQLRATNNPAEIVRLLGAVGADLDSQSARDAWLKLAAGDALPAPPVEVVMMLFRKARFESPEVREEWRHPAWLGDESSRVWLDSDGRLWTATLDPGGLTSTGPRPTDRINEAEFFHAMTGERLAGTDPHFFTGTFVIPAGTQPRMTREIEKRSSAGTSRVRDFKIPYWRLPRGVRLGRGDDGNLPRVVARIASALTAASAG